MLLLLATAALAAEGFYHPMDTAQASALYTGTSTEVTAKVEDMQAKLRAQAGAIGHYRESMDALGSLAPKEGWSALAELEREHFQRARFAQDAVDALISDFDAAVSKAFEKALSEDPGLVECEATVATGKGLPGLPARREPNPECKGLNRNATLASKLDADPALAVTLAELTTREMPVVVVPAAPLSLSTPRYLSVTELLSATLGPKLHTIDQADSDARDAIYEQTEPGPGSAERIAPALRDITARTQAQRRDLAAPLFSAASAYLAKKQATPPVSYCPAPAGIGGCTGEDATAALLPAVIADKKVKKSTL